MFDPRSDLVLHQDSTIFVSGSDTLIGSALVRRLRGEKFSARVLGADGEGPDLTDSAAVDAFFRDSRPDYVVHAGGRSGGIAANVRYPADLMYENLLAATNVIHAAHVHAVRKLLYLASSCIYPRIGPQPMSEDRLLSGPLEPTNEPYALAKLAGVKLGLAYRRQYGDDFIVGIPTNVYGIGDHFNPEDSHVIGALIYRAHEAKVQGQPTLTIWGTGAAEREFLFADDLADACLLVLRGYSDEAPINLAGGTELSIRELAEAVCRVVGYSGELVFDASRPDGMPRKALDPSRLAAMGWKPRVRLDDGLAATYRSYVERASREVVNV
jgi:GDP-L-fucose synthase